VFTSDHGYHLGEHGLWQKQSLFEESARVPLIISAPGFSSQGQAARTPVGLIDLFPTLTELCGVEAPDNILGQSLVPMLRDTGQQGRGWAVSQVRRGRAARRIFGYAIRTPQWRYTEWDGGRAGRELYDHRADPLEQRNLADAPDQEKVVAELSQTLRDAVAQSFPDSGKSPEVRPGTWAPNLTNP
jgi:iduronate 2-sulfatase